MKRRNAISQLCYIICVASFEIELPSTLQNIKASVQCDQSTVHTI